MAGLTLVSLCSEIRPYRKKTGEKMLKKKWEKSNFFLIPNKLVSNCFLPSSWISFCFIKWSWIKEFPKVLLLYYLIKQIFTEDRLCAMQTDTRVGRNHLHHGTWGPFSHPHAVSRDWGCHKAIQGSLHKAIQRVLGTRSDLGFHL